MVCCASELALMMPAMVPPVPTVQQITSKFFLSAADKISSQPLMAKALLPPSGIT